VQQPSASYLKPIDRAAVNEWREHAQAISERVTDRAHGQHDVQIAKLEWSNKRRCSFDGDKKESST